MVSGGFRPEARQNNPMTVSPNGGNGQSGKLAAEKTAKAAQLRMSGLPQGENKALAEQITAGGNVKTTASAVNPTPSSMNPAISSMLSEIVPIDAEPDQYLPITDGVDFGPGRGSEVVPSRLTASINQAEGIDIINRYLPDLMNATRLPGATDSYKRFVNYLKAQIL